MTDAPKRYCVINLGCKVNRVEADSFERELEALGFQEGAAEESDLVIVNTCTVTAEADKKARKAVRHSASVNAKADIVVTGCASAMQPSVFSEMSDRISVVPKGDVLDFLKRYVSSSKSFDTSAPQGTCASLQQAHFKRSERSRLGIKVQDGCDNDCSYCIVCKARGRASSVSVDDVVEQAVALAKRGIKEIVLTGIDIGAYESARSSLPDLLYALLESTDTATQGDYPVRFRISSIEPQSIRDDLIDLIAAAKGRICAHLHIPLQSGSDKVLSEMRRKYTSSEYMDLVARLRSALPHISLTTDVIVGFPGETDDDFARTRSVADTCGFSNMHVFPYSMRAGTDAAVRVDQVPADIKHARSLELRELAARLRQRDALARQGTTELFLVQDDGKMMSESYYEFKASDTFAPGELVRSTFDRMQLWQN